MELERIIREKIWIVEQRPIAWEKERVWKSIKKETTSKPRSFVFYYAAASLAVVAGLSYFLQVREQGELNLKITILESAILSYEIKNENIQHAAGMCETLTLQVEQKHVSKPIQSEKNPRVAIIAPADKIVPEKLIEIPPVVDQEINLRSPELVVLVHDQPVIEAIVGFIPKQPETVANLKKKKLHFRISRDKEGIGEGLSTEGNNKILTARIN